MQNIGKQGKEFFENLWEGLKNYCKGFVDGIVSFFSSMGVDLVGIFKTIGSQISSFFSNLWSGITGWLSNIWSSITGLFQNIASYIRGIASQAFSWGANIIGNIISGIQSAMGGLGSALSSVGSKIANYLGFHSPTKEGEGRFADEWMPNLMKMLSEGIKGGLPDIEANVALVSGSIRTLNGVENTRPGTGNDIVNGVLQALLQKDILTGKSSEIRLTLELENGEALADMLIDPINKVAKNNGYKPVFAAKEV